MPLPLEGILVVSLEQAVAAPMCSCRLADAGARVIKIERPEGDFARGYDDVVNGEASYFVWLNRGKQSVILDLAKVEDKRIFANMLARADVFIQNLKPGAIDRLGFSVETLRRDYPSLIVCSISGYGEEGPYSDRKAYDLLIQAESGLASVTGSPDSPGRVGVSVVDIASGMNAYEAILEALLLRHKTSQGAAISVSMFDAMADWLTVPLLQHEGGKPARRVGLAHPSIAPYGVFRTKDAVEILISIQNDREWRTLSGVVMNNPALAADPEFASNVARVQRRERTDDLVQEFFSSLSAESLITLLTKHDLAFAVVNDMSQLSRHPHLRRITVETERGPVRYPAPAARWHGEQTAAPIKVPALDADGEKLRREFSGCPQ